MLRGGARLLLLLLAVAFATSCGHGDQSGETGGRAPTAPPPARTPPVEQAAPTTPSAQPAPGAEAGEASPISPAAREEAQEIFASRCTSCHGKAGMGDGPASRGLTPPPRNFHDKAWQASVTDQQIAKVIQYGGASVGKSPAMPPHPDLVSKPQVVAALREMIRSFGR